MVLLREKNAQGQCQREYNDRGNQGIFQAAEQPPLRYKIPDTPDQFRDVDRGCQIVIDALLPVLVFCCEIPAVWTAIRGIERGYASKRILYCDRRDVGRRK